MNNLFTKIQSRNCNNIGITIYIYTGRLGLEIRFIYKLYCKFNKYFYLPKEFYL